MSELDRRKWNTRYRKGAYAERIHPAVYLVECIPMINPPLHRALDLACGAGRNALYLASQGFAVDAIDIAAEALQRGRQSASAQAITDINWFNLDLDDGLHNDLDDYGLVIMMRYLDIDLLTSAAERLVSGGYLLAEVHLQTDQVVAGPSSATFRAEPGELRTAANGLNVIQYNEGICRDPDGSFAALARMLAQKTGG